MFIDSKSIGDFGYVFKSFVVNFSYEYIHLLDTDELIVSADTDVLLDLRFLIDKFLFVNKKLNKFYNIYSKVFNSPTASSISGGMAVLFLDSASFSFLSSSEANIGAIMIIKVSYTHYCS